jgi:hypothetical protein
VGELNEQLDSKSMEIKWYIYMKVDPVTPKSVTHFNHIRDIRG